MDGKPLRLRSAMIFGNLLPGWVLLFGVPHWLRGLNKGELSLALRILTPEQNKETGEEAGPMDNKKNKQL